MPITVHAFTMYSLDKSWRYSNKKYADLGQCGMIIDKAGNLQICNRSIDDTINPGKCNIVVYSKTGTLLKTWGEFEKPTAIVQDSKGNFYVADLGTETIYKFNGKYEQIAVRGGTETFDFLCGLAIDKNDYIYALDKAKSQVTKFSPDGEIVRQFGKEGSSKTPGCLDTPLAIAYNPVNDHIMVMNYDGVIQIFNTSGQAQMIFRANFPDIKIKGGVTLSATPNGHVFIGFVSDPFDFAVEINAKYKNVGGLMIAEMDMIDPGSGKVYTTMPGAIIGTDKGTVYIMDQNLGRIGVYRPK